MEKTVNKEQGNSPGRDTNLDHASISNDLDNDNAFSENGLENNSLLNKAMNQKKPKKS